MQKRFSKTTHKNFSNASQTLWQTLFVIIHYNVHNLISLKKKHHQNPKFEIYTYLSACDWPLLVTWRWRLCWLVDFCAWQNWLQLVWIAERKVATYDSCLFLVVFNRSIRFLSAWPFRTETKRKKKKIKIVYIWGDHFLRCMDSQFRDQFDLNMFTNIQANYDNQQYCRYIKTGNSYLSQYSYEFMCNGTKCVRDILLHTKYTLWSVTVLHNYFLHLFYHLWTDATQYDSDLIALLVH